MRHFILQALFASTLAGLTACGGPETASDDLASTADEARGRPDVVECRSDRQCPRGSFCATELNFCITSERCHPEPRLYDGRCERLFGEDFICLAEGPHQNHCIPTDPATCRGVIECRSDRACPRGSYCEPGLNYCFTSSRCIVDGRPSNAFCQRTYGNEFLCKEYAEDSWHCVPHDLGICQ